MAVALEPKVAMEMTIADIARHLNWPTVTTNAFLTVGYVVDEDGKYRPLSRGYLNRIVLGVNPIERRKKMRHLVNEVILRDFLSTIEKQQPYGVPDGGYFRRKLREIGLTHDDTTILLKLGGKEWNRKIASAYMATMRRFLTERDRKCAEQIDERYARAARLLCKRELEHCTRRALNKTWLSRIKEADAEPSLALRIQYLAKMLDVPPNIVALNMLYQARVTTRLLQKEQVAGF